MESWVLFLAIFLNRDQPVSKHRHAVRLEESQGVFLEEVSWRFRHDLQHEVQSYGTQAGVS